MSDRDRDRDLGPRDSGPNDPGRGDSEFSDEEIEDLLGVAGSRGGGSGARSGPVRSTDDPGGEQPRPNRGSGTAPGTAQSGSGLPPGYVAAIGILFAAIAVVAVLFALLGPLENQESGSVGIGSVGIGERIEPFAVPIATSDLEGDANIDPEQACSVPGDDVLRICDYFDRPLVISFWFTKGAAQCVEEQDVFDRVGTRFADRAGFVSINVRDERDRVRELIAENDWQVTVGHDTDGAVSNIYRVGGCPTFLFVKPGGVLVRAEIGATSESELSTQVRSLIEDGT